MRRVAERDHPRRCGENLSKIDFTVEHVGSPPRMRGKRFYKLITAASGRITPAHAGKTYASVSIPLIFEDHPRACGENRRYKTEVTAQRGSPPRMRGKLGSLLSNKLFSRITPAHAGKTICNLRLCKITKDHPRACGENAIYNLEMFYSPGSPPRMRGKLKKRTC